MRANKHLTPVYIVYVDGRRLDLEHEGAVRSVTVKDCLNGISVFSIVFDTGAVKIQDKKLISVGSDVSIHLGYKDDVGEVFSGGVAAFRTILSDSSAERLDVSGCNALYNLYHTSTYRSFEGKAPSEVIKGILDAYSIKAEVDDFGTPKPFQSEENLTDYEYLIAQAEAYGKQVYATGNTVYIKDEVTVRSDEVIYEWGKSLISFEGAQDTGGLVKGVDYVGWDNLKDEAFVGNAELSDLPVKIGGGRSWLEAGKSRGMSVEARVDLTSTASEEARQLALGRLQNNSYKFGYARGKGEGNYKLRPGMRVMIKMVGEHFEGEYMAQTVTHRFSRNSGYAVEFTLKRNMYS